MPVNYINLPKVVNASTISALATGEQVVILQSQSTYAVQVNSFQVFVNVTSKPALAGKPTEIAPDLISSSIAVMGRLSIKQGSGDWMPINNLNFFNYPGGYTEDILTRLTSNSSFILEPNASIGLSLLSGNALQFSDSLTFLSDAFTIPVTI